MSVPDEVEEFAALLRALKDRTSRSYGSLARRVTMNTSTLHRYCAGEAVPQDFAPVERLAAFCGATPEERLRLHALWLSAVAARQRPRTADAAQARADTVAAADPGDAAVQKVEHDPDPDGPALSPTLSPAPTPRPWYRRRTLAVCGALLAALGTVSALSHDHSPEADASRSPGPRTTAPIAGSPLTWSADSQVWEAGCGHDYVIDKPPAQVPPPPVRQDAGVWAATQGAVHGRQTLVQISVQGRSTTAVVLEALRVRTVSRGNPAAGSAYAMDQGCGSELTPRRFTVNLDIDRPLAHPTDGADSGHTLPAVHFPFRVSAEDPEVLLVDATTQTVDARWYLELDWTSEGRTGTVRIDDHGRPFHTTAIKGMPRYWYGTNEAGGRAWVPYNG